MLWKHTCVYIQKLYYVLPNNPQNKYCHSCFLLAGHSEIIQLSSWNYKLWVQVLGWWTSLLATWGMATHKVDTSCLLDCFPGWSKCFQDSRKRFFVETLKHKFLYAAKVGVRLWSRVPQPDYVAICGILYTNSITLATSSVIFDIFVDTTAYSHIFWFIGSVDHRFWRIRLLLSSS